MKANSNNFSPIWQNAKRLMKINISTRLMKIALHYLKGKKYKDKILKINEKESKHKPNNIIEIQNICQQIICINAS